MDSSSFLGYWLANNKISEVGRFYYGTTSIRIPWKDNGYSGLICEQPCLNNACLRLKNIVSNSVVKDLSQYDVDMGCEANDKKAKEEYMVLQAKIREHEIIAFEAGEAQGHAAGLAEGEAKGRADGLAEGEAKKSRETALEMLKYGEPLTKIMKYSKLAKEDILLLAKENGIETVVA